MKNILFLAFCALLLSSCGDAETRALIETNHGPMLVKLYNETPRHRDNFVKLAEADFYDSLLFHRVIDAFMIQGGDPNSRNAKPGQRLGGGGPGYLIEHEIGAPHIKGTLAAARTSNPEKKSSGSQFYIVDGKKQTDATLDRFERSKKIKYNATQRELYKTVGGSPELDKEYTVFGELIDESDVEDTFINRMKRKFSGRDSEPIRSYETLNKISAVRVQPGDRPVEDVVMKVRILSKRPWH